MSRLPNTEKSLWREAYGEPLYPALHDELNVDVVIVGAGITGLTSAYLLKNAGKTVAVIEKDTVGGGTTGRTTGKVTSQHGLIYTELEKQIGFTNAQLYGDAYQAAVAQVATIVTEEKIACDWERDDNYVFTANPKKIDQFKQEAEVAARLGLPATFETDVALPFEVAGAVKFANQGKFDAEKYVLGLAAAVNGSGCYVFEHSNVQSIRDGNTVTVSTSRGKITAKDCIVATNVPTLPLMARGGFCALEYPTESYIVSAPYDKKLNGMYISPDSDHYSILPITVGGEQRLLVGGGGHLSGLRGSRRWRFNRLASYADRHFGPQSFDHIWSDRDYSAYDKLPLIGKLYPWSKHMFVATAFKKWGLSGGTMAGMILCDAITGQPNRWSEVFSPQRLKPVTSIPKAVFEQIKQLNRP